MNTLIVGGAGFVGANLVRACLRAGAERITVVDSLDPRLHASTAGLAAVRDQIELVQGDMRDAALMATLVAHRDVIFNCAGQTSHPLSMQQPVLDAEINVLGNVTLLEAVRVHAPTTTVVYTSTSTVIGKAIVESIDETHPERPLDIYSANKLAAEKLYAIYHRVHGIPTVMLRFPNLFGPYGKGNAAFGFMNYFIHLGWRGDEIQIFGDGKQMRNAIYVEDACEIMLRAARVPAVCGTPLFVAHPDHVSVRAIAEQIVATFRRGTIKFVEWPAERRRIEVDDVHISSAKLQSLIDWHPQYSLVAGLEATKETFERDEVSR